MRIIRFIKALWKYILFGNRVPLEQYVNRLDECVRCPYLNKEKWSCKKCGCYLTKKAKMSTEDCPEGNWNY